MKGTQMKTTKRLLTAGLALIMLAGLIACHKDNPNKETGSESVSGSSIPEESENFYDKLPDKTYNGADFVIMGWTEYLNLWFPQDEEGRDEISAALCKRNDMVTEKFDIKLVRQNSPYFLDTVSMTETAVLSDEDIYDVTIQNAIYGAQSSLNNIYLNLYELPYNDFTKPWWPQQCVEELTFDGKMFMASSYATYSGLYESSVMFFNKNMANNYKVSNPYTLVDNMEWTIDALFTMTKGVYEDVDRDGTVNWRDSFGYSSSFANSFWVTSSDISTVTKHDDGSLEIPKDYTRLNKLVDKLIENYYGKNEVFITDYHEMYDDNAVKIFAAGRSMFTPCYLRSAVNSFRYSSVDYGILPIPMLDETQKEYKSFSDDYLIAIPSIVSNPEMISVVLETLSYEGYYGVTPTFYNITMKTKLTEEDDDRRMLDIINDSRNTPFDYVYDRFAGFFTCLPDILTIRNGAKQSLATYYAENFTSVQGHYAAVEEGFKKSGNPDSK